MINAVCSCYVVQLTYADLALVYFFEQPKLFAGVDINLDKFPKLKALNERVRKDPGLDAWLKKRPANVFPPGMSGGK